MEISIEKKTENKLLSRIEVAGKIVFDKATPSYKDVTKKLSEVLKSKEDHIALKSVKTKFGHKEATFNANVYKDNESKKTTEKKGKKAKEKEKKAEDKAKGSE